MKCDKHSEKEAIAVCVNCGKGVCEDCRLNLGGKNYCQECADTIMSEKTSALTQSSVDDSKSEKGLDAGEGIVICLFSPIAGAIAWLVWHDKKPKKAQQACLIAVILFFVWLVIYIAYMASLSRYYY